MSDSTEETARKLAEIPDNITTAEAYRKSVATDPKIEYGFFSLEYQWLDKPHRHVFDLCRILDEKEKKVRELEEFFTVIETEEDWDESWQQIMKEWKQESKQ